MIARREGRHRAGSGRAGPAAVSAALGVLAVVAAVVLVVHGHPGVTALRPATPTAVPSPGSTSAVPTPPSGATRAVTPPATSPPATSPPDTSPPAAGTSGPDPVTGAPAGAAPDGNWWGVDSSGPITAGALANVRDWYQGARPQFWGRYLSGDYGVTEAELAFARAQGLYVYLIVGDRNCSQCSGGDACGNDRTAAQAADDARDAAQAATRLRIGRGAVLFKDIEQVSSCRGEPTADYLTGWYRTIAPTGYRAGFYGNVHEQDYDFPRGYCAAVAADGRFASDVVLDMNEDEPLIGAPSGTTGPRLAPSFAPRTPNCAPASATRIWQYGESTDPGNDTDIDELRPGTAGLLAPDGTVTAAARRAG